MKISRILMVAVMALPFCLSSCQLLKKSAKEEVTELVTKPVNHEMIDKVSDNAQTAEYITSKIKFSVVMGDQKVSLTGNLKMKHDDVIQLQLMAFGFVEAGRLEFTKDYVLLIDRIHKQFIKVPYNYLDFMRNSGINFYTLQALFWNELFKPNQKDGNIATVPYTTSYEGDHALISLEEGRMRYYWLTDRNSGRINTANITYYDSFKGDTQLNWNYSEFSPLGNKMFPTNMTIDLSLGEKKVDLGLRLNYLNNDSKWETRTKVSDKYRQVEVEQILQRFMDL